MNVGLDDFLEIEMGLDEVVGACEADGDIAIDVDAQERHPGFEPQKGQDGLKVRRVKVKDDQDGRQGLEPLGYLRVCSAES